MGCLVAKNHRSEDLDTCFLFLHLPVEVRNQVYTYLITGYEIKIDTSVQRAATNLPSEFTTLPLVSLQIHAEVMTALYGLNAFRLPYDALEGFLEAIGERNSALMQTLLLDLLNAFINPYQVSRGLVTIL